MASPHRTLPPSASPVRTPVQLPHYLRPVETGLPDSPAGSPAPRPGAAARLRHITQALRPAPGSAARFGHGLGTALVALSLLLLSWGVWETSGSAWWAARGQQERAEQFDELQAAAAAQAPVFAPGDSVDGVAVPILPDRGEVVGRLLIPALDVDEVVSVGTDDASLRSGPGVWEAGVFPGAPGNATVAGHRTTYGGPFRHIDRLGLGDRIIFEVPGRAPAVFEVRGTQIVHPSQVAVTGQGPGVRLTLTTCHPVGSADKRLIVQAELVEGEFATSALPRDRWEFRGA